MTSHAIALDDTGDDFWMYLQLRATPGTVNRCLTHLDRHLQAHPNADVEIVGIGTDPRTVRVIIGVNLGDSFKIKSRPENVLAAYEFVQSLSASMASFWPQYLTGTPTEEERDLLVAVVTAGGGAGPRGPARPARPARQMCGYNRLDVLARRDRVEITEISCE
jgi:hypothetical protein